MATHGRARDKTEADLMARKAFRRQGFGMSAVVGDVDDLGRLPEPHAAEYRAAATCGAIVYTVLSYRTPILWVLDTGEISAPRTYYSNTTSHHQGFARCYVR